MWYSAFSDRSPIATAFLISAGSSWASSCSRTLISSRSFFLMCSGIHGPVAGSRSLQPQEIDVSNLDYTAAERAAPSCQPPAFCPGKGLPVAGCGENGLLEQITCRFSTVSVVHSETTEESASLLPG